LSIRDIVSKNNEISDFMKTFSVAAEFYLEDKRIGGET